MATMEEVAVPAVEHKYLEKRYWYCLAQH
jgi:hypothetical protein